MSAKGFLREQVLRVCKYIYYSSIGLSIIYFDVLIYFIVLLCTKYDTTR